ncbi:CLUMA_CG009782, isoform A [Clunio marinus]|uniref:CLUMA_CG009782, isoform A n=1 Tax=Clunio marinus TaxID=568069 RepID=A0A1J1I7V5_9DIPT|nr:CLUMA_CG009782, isoform A [Clunio marinus]
MYTNPAFCQDEATYNRPLQTTPTIVKSSPARVHRSESIRSFHSVASTNRSLRSGIQRMNSGLNLNCSHHQLHQTQQLSLPPRPGPKPISNRVVEGNVDPPKVPPYPTGSRYGSISDVKNQSTSGRYALVPVEDLNSSKQGRYAVLPAQTASRYISKSQENLDQFENDGDELPFNYSDQFTSLPPISSPKNEGGMIPAFSTDFGSKSFILFDQKNQQRYAVVPTEENEEIVDDNHEIIQMHNGKAHRYAVIPTDEEETCLNGDFDKPVPPTYSVTMNRRTSPQRTPQKHHLQQKYSEPLPSTPKKNLATQKLHEHLMTPQKQSPFIRQHSTPLSQRNSPYRVRAHHASNPRLVANGDFTPQRLQYDQKMRMASSTTLNLEQRTTAVIQPRLNTTTAAAASIYNETTTTTSTNNESIEKPWNKNLESHKHAIATIGFISLLLMFCGVINSGLFIYMTSMSSITALYTGRSLFLDIGILSGFATVALSFLGFKFRYSDWFPNRNYISGFILVTFFALMNCCGLLVLLIVKPIKGTPIHDVSTGISSALSSLILLFISLGVIGSKLCQAPPADNRVDVY